MCKLNLNKLDFNNKEFVECKKQSYQNEIFSPETANKHNLKKIALALQSVLLHSFGPGEYVIMNKISNTRILELT